MEDFKREAVALMTERCYKVSEAARSLDIGDNLLCRWKREYTEEAVGSRLTRDEYEGLKRVRKEVRMLRMNKEILVKASQYFAREMKLSMASFGNMPALLAGGAFVSPVVVISSYSQGLPLVLRREWHLAGR